MDPPRPLDVCCLTRPLLSDPGAIERGRGVARGNTDTLESVQIGELAKTAGVTTKTIRYYESIGVLDEPQRTESGYRTYGPGAIERLDFVRQAQSSGLALAEIRSILEIKDDGGQACQHTTALLRGHLDELDARIVELEAAREELRAMYERAGSLDPAECTDANRCQIITEPFASEP